MASNGKCLLESTHESLLNIVDFFDNAMLRVQYPRKYPAYSHLNHCDRFSHYCASLAKERKNYTNRPHPPPSVTTCRSGTPAKVSSNANSLVANENTRVIMIWLIKAYDCNQNRVLNVLYMGLPFFPHAIPTYEVLPYSMIIYYIHDKYRRTAQTDKHGKCKAILVPAVRILCMRPAGKNAFLSKFSQFWDCPYFINTVVGHIPGSSHLSQTVDTA